MGHDLRAVLRRLWARRLLNGAFLGAQGLVIATTIVLFAVSDQIFFKPLPYPAAERIVHLEAQRRIVLDKTRAEQDALTGLVSAGTVLHDGAYIGVSNTIFLEHSAAVREWRFRYAAVTPEFFALFGNPTLGRALRPDDLRRGPRAMVISHGIWQRVFGGRPDILDAPIEIPGTSYDPYGLGRSWQVIGIMPPGFEFPAGANVWVYHEGPRVGALGVGPLRDLPTFARLAPGVTLDQVSGLLHGIKLTPLREYLTPRGASAFLFLCAAALLVLFSSWLQVAGMVAARIAAQPRELIIRTALGGTRWHVLRPMVLDALVIAGLSIAAGLSLAAPIAAAVTRMLPPELRIASDIWLGARVLVFGAVLFSVGVLMLVVVPGAMALRLRLAGLRAGSSSTRFQGNQRANRVLLAAQMAASVVLLYVAGLAWHSSRAIAGVDLGFDPDRLVAVRLPATIPPSSSTVEDRMVDVMNQEQLNLDALRAVRDLMGVEAAAPVRRWPLQSSSGSTSQRLWAAAAPDDPVNARITVVSEDYLAMIGARLVEGRGIQSSDARGSVVVVDETMAEQLRRSGPVVGSEVRTTNRTYRVIGVVRNMVYERPDEQRQPEVFLNGTPSSALLVRLASRATERTREAILSTLAPIWGPTRAPRTLVSIEDEARRARLPYVSQQRLLGALAVVTLFALTAGVLTTVALVLHRRRLDLGIRYALGAGRGDVRRLVWRDIVLVLTAGVGVGLAGGWVAGRIMQQYWYGITPLDPSTTWGVVVFLAVIVAAAIEWPVRRFQYVSPFMALKEE